MILGFKKTFPWGEPTNFKEKILAGVGFGPIAGPPKIHTIRAGSRWKAGDLIHMAYGVRSKNYEQFNKGIEGLQRVVSVQEIEMEWFENAKQKGSWIVKITIDGKFVHDPRETNRLAVNDGFASFLEFFDWFSHKDFKGQIIHWTDYRYK